MHHTQEPTPLKRQPSKAAFRRILQRFIVAFLFLFVSGEVFSASDSPAAKGAGADSTKQKAAAQSAALPSRQELSPSLNSKPAIGYFPRSSGFDLDDDGMVGEPEDCRVCNGRKLDIDNDGVIEDQLYVDADNGSDELGDGTPQKPYKTIRKAWSMADGPGDGAEDIICFRGSAKEENIQPGVSGLPTTRTKPKSASEVMDWEFPKDPTMLVGWDYDGDGAYPPADPDDIAILDGAGLKRAFTLNIQGGTNPPRSFVELAHFTVRDYGFQTAADGTEGGDQGIGFLFVGRNGTNRSSHIYIHDLEFVNINRGKPKKSNTVVFNFFGGPLNLKHFAACNLKVENAGGYFARGDFGATPAVIDGPLRFQNISYTGLGGDYGVPPCGDNEFYSTITGFKLWGYVNGIEIIDSFFDANLQHWKPRPAGPVNAVVVDGCACDWTIRNNIFLNWKNYVSVKGAPDWCSSRAVDDVLVDQNLFYNTINYYPQGPAGVFLAHEPNSTTVGSCIDDVTVTSNYFVGEHGLRYCLYSEAGNGQGTNPGTIVFRGNVCDFNEGPAGGTVVHLSAQDTYPLQNFICESNVFAGLPARAGNRNFVCDYEVKNWRADHNIYSKGLPFERLGTLHSLSDWQESCQVELHSIECTTSVSGTLETGFVVTIPPDCKNTGANLPR